MSVDDLGSFTYSSQPHSAPIRVTKKYRDQTPINDGSLTLMSDPRVVRGSTFSLARKITKSKDEFSKSQNTSSLNHLRGSSRANNITTMPTYNFEVKPFSSDEIDVSKYLVQQDEFPAFKKAVDSQTDEFIPRPDSPDYIPAKIGVDIGTQVEDVQDLFHFDEEVAPILEVIVKKTLEQALFEVDSEEELASLERAAEDYRKEKLKGDEWINLREAQAIENGNQIKDRIATLKKAREDELEAKTVVAGLQMMRQIYPNIVDGAVNKCLSSGAWNEPDNFIAEQDILPALVQDCSLRLDAHNSAQVVLDDLLHSAEELYLTAPTYVEPDSSRQLSVIVKFSAAVEPVEVDDADGENAMTASSAVPANPSTVVEVKLNPAGTIESVERTIRSEVKRLKAAIVLAEETAAAVTEGDEASTAAAAEAAAAAPPAGTVLPDGAALANVRKQIQHAVSQRVGEPVRDIAYDAVLWNFPSLVGPITIEVPL